MKRMLLFACSVLAMAAEKPAATHWPASRLRQLSLELAARVSEAKVAVETLARFSNHQLMLTHRQADGEAEIHENQVDIFVVQSGEATLVTGGELRDARTTAPGELRGTAIGGGQKRKLGPGDVVHIPAGTPHQVLAPDGGRFTYLIIKVNAI